MIIFQIHLCFYFLPPREHCYSLDKTIPYTIIIIHQVIFFLLYFPPSSRKKCTAYTLLIIIIPEIFENIMFSVLSHSTPLTAVTSFLIHPKQTQPHVSLNNNSSPSSALTMAPDKPCRKRRLRLYKSHSRGTFPELGVDE